MNELNGLDFKRAAEDVEVIEDTLEWNEQKLERHKVLLNWIEQQRQETDLRHPTSTLQEDHEDQAVLPETGSTTASCDRRKRGPKASVVLGLAKIMKANPRKRNMRTQKTRQPEFEPPAQDLAIPQVPTTMPRTIKKEATPLRPIRPQRVSKAESLANASVKSMSGTQRRGVKPPRSLDRARSKRRPAPQRPQPAAGFKTRSGRISRTPVSLGSRVTSQSYRRARRKKVGNCIRATAQKWKMTSEKNCAYIVNLIIMLAL